VTGVSAAPRRQPYLPIISHIARARPGKIAGIRNVLPMNAPTITQGKPAEKSAPVSPRVDLKFIEDHELVERYLENKLPFKGARDLEQWCRAHPDYLDELKLSERAHASLKLLEASGSPQDLGEPKPPWWKSLYLLIGLAALAFVCLMAFSVLAGKYALLQGKLEDTKRTMLQGPLVQPATEKAIYISPDHAPGRDLARIKLNRATPLLMDVHIDLGYTQNVLQFRMFVDKQDQGRALVLNNLLKDSNGELRITLNSTGMSAGIYTVRIEAMPQGGTPKAVGWLILDVT
jgi:hypothetical protein